MTISPGPRGQLKLTTGSPQPHRLHEHHAEPFEARAEREDARIAQRRAELPTLVDRVAAVEAARERIPEHARRWYDESVLEEDLRYHLDVFDEAAEVPAARATRLPCWARF